MSKTLGFLRGAHVLIATPTNLAEVMRFQEFRGIFDNLKAIAIDEADACFKVSASPRLNPFPCWSSVNLLGLFDLQCFRQLCQGG